MPKIDGPAVVNQCYDFIMERARAYYMEAGVRPDVFEAVLVLKPSQPYDFDERVRAVTEFRKLPEAESLSAANKRIANILKNLTKVSKKIDSALLKETAEKNLHKTLRRIKRKRKEIKELSQLKVVLGHTAYEVFAGALLGFSGPTLYFNFLR